jgi:catechol 2,3-dioxygenase-like lactoylglutathione lyase family enzyme
MSIRGIDHVQLAAPPGCEPAARRYFGDVLGLVEIEKPATLKARGGVWFRLGEQQLHVGVEPAFVAARKAHPALSVASDSLDALADRIRAAGAAVVWNNDVPHTRHFYTEDPWGNRLELVAYP